jgi:predicted nicotinamide N-methyase
MLEIELQTQESVSVKLVEILDASYGSYLWPASLVLSLYLAENPHLVRNKRILELGAGVGLCGLVGATLGAKRMSLTDLSVFPHVLENLSAEIHLNNLVNCNAFALNWGSFDIESSLLSQGFELLIGSDVFYNPSDFEDLIRAVSIILSRSPPDARFITAYHERSSKRNIQWLLERWNLKVDRIAYPFHEFANGLERSLRVKSVPDGTDLSIKYQTLNGLSSIFLFAFSINR